MTRQLTMGPQEWAMLAGLSLLWGGSFLFNGLAVREMPVLSIVAIRLVLASVALWLLVLALRRPLPRAPRIWGAFLLMGLLNGALPFSLIVAGQTVISSGLASIFNATTPLFGVLIAGAFLPDERLTLRRLLGVTAGFCGVAVMIGTDALAGLGGHVLAQAGLLAAACSYGIAGSYGRRFHRWQVDPIVTAAGGISGAALLVAPVALWRDGTGPALAAGPVTWGALLALALASTALAYVLFYRILARAGATNVLMVTFLVPVSAILFGAVFLGESLSPASFAGMGFIGIGLALIDGRLFRRRKAPAEPA